MNAINNFNVLPFYTSLAKQNGKKWYAFGNIYPLASPRDKILPFQIVMASTVASVSALTIHNYKTGTTIASGLTPTIYTPEGQSYSIIYLKLSTISQLAEGRYYLTITVDGTTLYSEIFNAISDLSEYVKIEYWNEDDLYTKDKIQVYFGDDFKFVMYACTDIGKPEYLFEEELTKRLGYKFLESQVSNKVYKFTFLAPEYLTDSMRIIRLSDYIKLTQGDEEFNALTFAYDAKWEQQGDLASVECEFETDTIIQKLQSFNRRQLESFYNALLSNIDEPILFDTEVVAQYYADFQTGGLIQGKLIHELELETELKEGAFIPIDNNDSTPAKRISVSLLTASSHTHTNKALLDLITQSAIDVLSHLSVVDGRIKVDVDFWSTGEVSAYGAGSTGGGGASGSLGALVNVGIWADEIPTSDRVMVQLAGSTHWSSKLISEIAGLDTVALGSYLTTNQYATQSYVTTKVAELVGTAPETLNTLNELATALGNDPNFATSITNLIGTKWTQDNTKIANWDSAFGALHSHANKSVLDGISSELITNWNLAFTNNHTHPNKTIIDSITQANLDVLAKLSIVDGNLKVDTNFWSTGEVSAYGAGTGTGGGSGLITSVLGSAGLGGSYLDSDLTNTFNAYTINLINNNLTSALGRIGTLETSTPNVSWGTPTSQYTPLTINSVSRNLSLDGHTHSYLPLSGGTLSSTNPIVLALNSTQTSNNLSLRCNSVDKINLGYYGPGAYIYYSNKVGNTEIQLLDSAGLNDFKYVIGANKYTVWHAGNDGAGSGLDADLLRGVTPSNLSVLSATRLATTRAIWGQNFDGTGNVSGDLSGATTGSFSGLLSSVDLTVTNTGTNRAVITQRSIGDVPTDFMLGSNNANRWSITCRDSSSSYSLGIYNYGRTAYDIFIAGSTGNVGIGTSTDPGYKLDVNGTFRTTGAAYLNSTLSVAGHAYFANGTTYYINSAGSANLNALSCASTATFNSDILIPRANAWGYIKNTSVSGGIKIGTGNASGTYVDAISITTAGNYVRSEIPFIANNTLTVDGLSTLKGISVTNGSYSKAISMGGNSHLQMDGVVASYTYNLPATIGWYRVAVSAVGVERPFGQFDISWTLSSYHGSLSLTAGMMYSSAPFISQTAYTNFGTCITKSRIVYHTTYSGTYAYLEVYNETGKAVSLTVRGYNLTGWNLYSASTVGSIPSGYSNKEISHISGYMTSGNVAALGEITAYSASDERLKENIRPLTNSLSIIESMNPVSYKWNNIAKELNPMKGNDRDFGLIAQELETIVPELVHTIYGGQYKSIDYVKIIPHLICAIKQLKSEIDMLKS